MVNAMILVFVIEKGVACSIMFPRHESCKPLIGIEA